MNTQTVQELINDYNKLLDVNNDLLKTLKIALNFLDIHHQDTLLRDTLRKAINKAEKGE